MCLNNPDLNDLFSPSLQRKFLQNLQAAECPTRSNVRGVDSSCDEGRARRKRHSEFQNQTSDRRWVPRADPVPDLRPVPGVRGSGFGLVSGSIKPCCP